MNGDEENNRLIREFEEAHPGYKLHSIVPLYDNSSGKLVATRYLYSYVTQFPNDGFQTLVDTSG